MSRIERWLVESGLAKASDVERVAADPAAGPIAEALVRHGLVDERETWRELARLFELPLVEFEDALARVDAAVVRSVPRPYQDRKRVVPLRRTDGVLQVASCDPEVRVLDLADALGCERAQLLMLTPTDFRRLQWALDLGQLGAARFVRSHPVRTEDLLEHDVRMEPAHVGLLEAILADAAGDRASDVHLERYGERVRVRLRVDGVLHDVEHYRIDPRQMRGMVNVLKVRAALDIAERRRPQGGRFSARIAGRDFDLRVQTQPSLEGEFAVVRLLPQDPDRFAIDALGFPDVLTARYRRVLESPAGLVLIAGPTGSGKSTTLYAGLQHLAADSTRKVISIEDPVEYAIEGIEQTQVQPAVGFGFAEAMRTFVRQDPDVILIGEIRDPETALEALRAAQTGHVVLSTVHANDSVDAVQRLYDLGMNANSVAGELIAIFAQRLARRICTACRSEVAPDPELLHEVFGDAPPAGLRTFRGTGCERCRGLGYRGRIAVGELLPTSRELRLAIAHHAALDELRDVARATGLHPLRRSALEQVERGEIAFEELRRLLTAEMLSA